MPNHWLIMSLFLPRWAAIQRLEETVFYEPLVLQKGFTQGLCSSLGFRISWPTRSDAEVSLNVE